MANLLDDPEVQKYLYGEVDPTIVSTAPPTPEAVLNQPGQGASYVPPAPAVQQGTDTPTQFAFQQPQKIQSILDLISENKPVQDPSIDQRYKKAAMLDSLGQAFGNLAGAVGVGMGASVPRLPVDNNIARLYGMKEAEKQRYLQQKQDWDRQMLQGKIQEMGMDAQSRKEALANAKWKADYELKADKNKKDYEIALGKAKTQAEKDAANQIFKERDLKIKAFAAESGRINANKPSASEISNDPNKIVYSWQNPVTKEVKNYTAYELQNEFDAAKQNPANGDVKAIMANYQNNSVLGQKEIVTRALNNQAVEKAKQDDLDKRANFTLSLGDMDKQPKVPIRPKEPVATTTEVPASSSAPATKRDWSKNKRK